MSKVAHAFILGTLYSKVFNAHYVDKQQKKQLSNFHFVGGRGEGERNGGQCYWRDKAADALSRLEASQSFEIK